MIYKKLLSLSKYICLGILISGAGMMPVSLEAKRSKTAKRFVTKENAFLMVAVFAFIIYQAISDATSPKKTPRPKKVEHKCAVCLETSSESPTKKFIPLPCCENKQVLCNECLAHYQAGSPCPYCRQPLASDLFQTHHVPQAKNVQRPDADVHNGTDRATQDMLAQFRNEDNLAQQQGNHLPHHNQNANIPNPNIDAAFRNFFGLW